MKKFLSILLLVALVFNMSIVFADTVEATSVTSKSDSQGLNMTLMIAGVYENHIKAGLIQASFSLYDQDKQLLMTQDLKSSMYNFEYFRYNLHFDVPVKAGDVFYLSLDRKSEYIGPIHTILGGVLNLKELKKIELHPFHSAPGGSNGSTGGELQFEGNALNPISLTAIIAQKTGEVLVPVVVNGELAQGVEFEVYGSDGKEVVVKPTDNDGFLRIPYTTQKNFTMTLKNGQTGYINSTEVYLPVMNIGADTVTLIALKRETQEIVIPTGGTNVKNTLRFAIGSSNVDVGGKNEVMDVAPFIVNGRTQVPLRFIGEQLGATIGWNDAERMVTYTTDDVVIKLWIDNSIANVNGVSVTLDVAPFIVNGRTVVPIRFVSENLGATVEWFSETNEILITK